MPRSAWFDAPERLHHVIIRGIDRERVIPDGGDREELVRRMGEPMQEKDHQR